MRCDWSLASCSGGVLPGKIYLCLPGQEKSFVTGSFEVQVIKPK